MECILPAVSEWRTDNYFRTNLEIARPKLFSAEFENRSADGGLKGRATKRS